MISSFVARCGIALVLMATCGVAAEHPPLVLTAYHARFLNHRAEVRWAVETWPAGLQGFETKIEFRSSPDQRFQPLPLSMNDDLVVHPEATYAYASQAGLARVIQAMEDGLMNEVPEVLQRAAVSQPGLTNRIQEVWEDADVLAQWGLARILPAVMLGAEHRITLRPRWSDGLGAPLAVMTLVATEERPVVPIQGFTIARSSSGDLEATWTIPRTAWKAVEGNHCRLQASEDLWDLESGWHDLPGDESGDETADVVTFSWTAPETTKRTDPVWFRVVPIVVLPSGVERRLEPSRALRLKPVPPPVPCEVQATWVDGVMEVRWMVGERPEGHPSLRAFRLLRKTPQDTAWTPIARVEPDVRWYRDHPPVPTGGQATYEYQLEVEQEDFDGVVLGGGSFPRTTWNLPPLEKPVIAEPQRVQEDGHAGYRLSWQIPHQEGLQLRLQSRWDATWDSFNIPVSSTGCFVPFEVTPAGKVLVLRLLVRREADGASIASEPVRLLSWRIQAPDPVETVTAKEEFGGVLVEWRSSNSHSDVGFEIRLDGAVVIEAKHLGPWERRAWIPVTTLDKPVTVAIRAVVDGGPASPPVEVQTTVHRRQEVRVPSLRGRSFRDSLDGAIDELTLWHDAAKTRKAAVYHIIHVEGTSITPIHGLRETWDAEGHHQARLQYVMGSLHGLQRWWHPDGSLAQVALYDDDRSQPWTPERVTGTPDLDDADRAWIAAHVTAP